MPTSILMIYIINLAHWYILCVCVQRNYGLLNKYKYTHTYTCKQDNYSHTTVFWKRNTFGGF